MTPFFRNTVAIILIFVIFGNIALARSEESFQGPDIKPSPSPSALPVPPPKASPAPEQTTPITTGIPITNGGITPTIAPPEPTKTPPPTDLKCVDSDEGINAQMMGFAVLGTNRKDDYCTDSGTVVEYYCTQQGTIDSQDVSCGGFCEDGVCVMPRGPPPEPACSDPDGGLNYIQAATADDRDARGIGSWWEDVCLLRVPCQPSDYGYGHPISCLKYTEVDECSGPLCNLQEGFCKEDGKSSNINYDCQYGCLKGACRTEPEPACYGYAGISVAAKKSPALNTATLTEPKSIVRKSPVNFDSLKLTNLQLSATDSLAAKNRAIMVAMLERKVQMLKLAQQDPQMFLNYTVPSELKRKISPALAALIESEFDGTGNLEIYEKPHLGEGHDDLGTDGHYDYVLNVKEKKYKLKAGTPFPQNLKSGNLLKIRGFAIDDYLVASDISQSGVTLKDLPTTENNLGVMKIAIIKTKAPGTGDISMPELTNYMNKAKRFIEEASYGQATIQWDVYGYYQTTKQGWWSTDAIKAADPFVDFTKYTNVIFVDPRNTCCKGTVGRITHTTADGTVKFGDIYFTPNAFTSSMEGWAFVAHELGHNMGLYHANALNCGDKSIDSYDNCVSHEYRDAYDIMGGFDGDGKGFSAYYNTPHKEILGWLNGKETVATTDGVYTINPITSTTGPVVLKVPRKKDDAGNPTDYYYLEYRTPVSFDTTIVNKANLASGVLIHVESIEKGFDGGGDTHLIDTTPPSDLQGEQLETGQEFTDNTNLKIKTLSADGQRATVQITLSQDRCERQDPDITISPANITARMNEQAFFDVIVKNNDPEICSDRKMYMELPNFRTGSAISYGQKNLPTSSRSSASIVAGERNLTNMAIKVYDPVLSATTMLNVLDAERGLLKSQSITVTRNNQELPTWPGQDVARKLFYAAAGDGKYLMDKNGTIYRTGKTMFSTDNGPKFDGETNQAVSAAMYNNDSILVLDSFGNVTYAGKSSNYGIMKSINYDPETLSCAIASDIKIIPGYNATAIELLDQFGYVKTASRISSGFGMYDNCKNWEGKTGAYQEGQNHARALALWDHGNGFASGYYVLSKDGTIYACGSANLNYTKYVNKPFSGTANNEAVAFALDQSRGLLVLDKLGHVYTTGNLQFKGEPGTTISPTRDITFIPGTSGGYAILTGDGTISEFR